MRFLILFLSLFFASDALAAFSYNRTITIDHTKCGSSNSTDKDVLIYISDTTFKVTGSGGHVTDTQGDDIGFFSDSGLATPLFWEIESYDGTNGVLWAWVKVPTVSSSVDTVIYVGYGDAAITTFQSTATSVWNSAYKGVWHLPDGSSLTALDSTTTGANAAAITGTATAGKTGPGGVSIAGGTQHIDFGDVIDIQGTNITIEGWANRNANNAYHTLLTRNGTGGPAVPLQWQCTWLTNADAPANGFRFDFVDTGGTVRTTNSSSGAINDTAAWHYVVCTYDGVNVKLYADGASVGSAARTESITTTVTGDKVRIGTDSPRGSNYANGKFDEIRVSNVARSADWITTSYNNQNNPATFMTLGSEVAPTPTPTPTPVPASCSKGQACSLCNPGQCGGNDLL